MDDITDSMHMSLSKLWELVMDTESLACCSPWGHKELDTAELLNRKIYISECVCVCVCVLAQTVKRLSAMQETRVQSLGWEDPLEKEMAAHSSILAWKIPWTVEPGRLPSMGSQRVRYTERLHFTLYTKKKKFKSSKSWRL